MTAAAPLEVTDPLAASLLHGIVVELEADLQVEADADSSILSRCPVRRGGG
jgi:hypothetical protein